MILQYRKISKVIKRRKVKVPESSMISLRDALAVSN